MLAANDPHRELYCALDIGLGDIAEAHRERARSCTRLPPFERQTERATTIDTFRREQYSADRMRRFVSTAPSVASRPSSRLSAPTHRSGSASVVYRRVACGLPRPSSLAALSREGLLAAALQVEPGEHSENMFNRDTSHSCVQLK